MKFYNDIIQIPILDSGTKRINVKHAGAPTVF